MRKTTHDLAQAIISSLRRRGGFDSVFDLEDEILNEIKQEIADTIDAHNDAPGGDDSRATQDAVDPRIMAVFGAIAAWGGNSLTERMNAAFNGAANPAPSGDADA